MIPRFSVEALNGVYWGREVEWSMGSVHVRNDHLQVLVGASHLWERFISAPVVISRRAAA